MTTVTAPRSPTEYSERAFPELDAAELDLLRPLGCEESYPHEHVLFRAGEKNIDFYIVLTGGIDIRNPTDADSLIITHGPRHFVGDIDLLTRRPVIVSARTNGPTSVLRIPGDKLRHLLNTVPRVSEKLLVAFQVRRELLRKVGVLGIKVVGSATCKDTNAVREFLHKNFMPFTWFDLDAAEGRSQWTRLGSPRKTPVIECNDGTVLANPTLHDLAHCAGVWEGCPGNKFDFAIVGAGPAGMTAAVYAASEGLNTLVVDKLGPGGQAGGSSKIENFIGFPAGLSGADLAQRGVLQMLKFGATMVAPINVQKLIPAQREDAPHVIELDCGERIEAHTILIATGAYWRKLDAKGADRFMQAGMYYACTSVEGYLYKGKEVVVIGAGNSAGQAVMFLAEHCACKVHMVIRAPELGPGMSEYLSQRIRATPNVVIHTGAEVTEVFGDSRIEEVAITAKATKKTEQIKAAALFVFIGAEPYVGWLPEGIARDQLGYLLTGVDVVKAGRWPLRDREPCPLETSIPRVLAAGDVRSGSTKRVGFAVGDGSLSVTCAHRLRAAIK